MAGKSHSAHSFTSELYKEKSGIGFHYIEFPKDAEKIFGKKGMIRVLLEVGEHQFRRALIPTSSGFHRIIMGEEIRKAIGVKTGDRIKAQIRFDPTVPELVIPEELQSIFDMEPEVEQQFHSLAPGMKRQICLWISEGKKVETRVNRALEILRRFQSGRFKFGK